MKIKQIKTILTEYECPICKNTFENNNDAEYHFLYCEKRKKTEEKLQSWAKRYKYGPLGKDPENKYSFTYINLSDYVLKNNHYNFYGTPCEGWKNYFSNKYNLPAIIEIRFGLGIDFSIVRGYGEFKERNIWEGYNMRYLKQLKELIDIIEGAKPSNEFNRLYKLRY